MKAGQGREENINASTDEEDTYNLPFTFNFVCFKYLPFLPEYDETACMPKKRSSYKWTNFKLWLTNKKSNQIEYSIPVENEKYKDIKINQQDIN